MKIGLLECDHVREEFRYIAGDYRDMFPALFQSVTDDWEWIFYDVVNGSLPTFLNDCDAYLCTGSKFSVYDDEPWIHQLQSFVRLLHAHKKPFVGVCFGHQLLGEALGGKVQKAEVGWCVGVHEFQKTISNPLFDVVNSPFNLLMMCQDQVVVLPPKTQSLASTADCSHAMILVDEYMLGIQAHPEFTVDYEKALIETRVERIGSVKAAVGLQSLLKPTHSRQIAQLIVNFLLSLGKNNDSQSHGIASISSR